MWGAMVWEIFTRGPESCQFLLLEYPWGSVHKTPHLPTLQELLSRVDILALTETHHFPDQQFLVIPGYQHFAVARPCKVGQQVRKHSGDILIYVSELCSSAVSVWKVAEDGTKLWLKFTDLGNFKPLFFCITYVPP
jgi:hypothetical protein